MHESIAALQKLMRQWAERLDQMEYEEMQQFQTKRNRLMADIQQTEFSEQDIAKHREAVKEILSYDEAILAKMTQLKEEAGKELVKLNAAKQRKLVYEGYGEYSGAFFDKKK
jgi:hypothetical protein